jgi:ABC-2 type transport system permease protein
MLITDADSTTVIISFYSEPALPWRIIGSGYLGIFLLGAVLIALGSFISVADREPDHRRCRHLRRLPAALGARHSASAESLDRRPARSSSTSRSCSITRRFAQGVIDTSSVVFYLSATLLGLFLTLRTIESMRWRRA